MLFHHSLVWCGLVFLCRDQFCALGYANYELQTGCTSFASQNCMELRPRLSTRPMRKEVVLRICQQNPSVKEYDRFNKRAIEPVVLFLLHVGVGQQKRFSLTCWRVLGSGLAACKKSWLCFPFSGMWVNAAEHLTLVLPFDSHLSPHTHLYRLYLVEGQGRCACDSPPVRRCIWNKHTFWAVGCPK